MVLRLLVAAWVAVALSANPAVTILIDEADAPYMYAVEGKPNGIYPALIHAAFKAMRVPVNLEARPWKRALAMLDKGEAGLVGLYKNAEREARYDFSEPVYVERLLVYTARGKAFDYLDVTSLKGLRVGLRRGWNYGQNLERTTIELLEEVDTDEQNFKKLKAGRLDALICTQGAGAKLAAKYDAVASAIPFSEGITYLAFHKRHGKAQLLKDFSTTLAVMRKSGEFLRIVQAATPE